MHLANPSARELFEGDRSGTVATTLGDWLTEESIQIVRERMARFHAASAERRAWIGGHLRGRRANGETFEFEATLSQGGDAAAASYTLILRDVHALHDAEQRIHQLQSALDALQEEYRLGVLDQPRHGA